jgi:tetratricopeptide (TPR) repeat protein
MPLTNRASEVDSTASDSFKSQLVADKLLTTAHDPSGGRLRAEWVMARAHGDRVVIEEFCPLAESIEWQIGQRYWSERGSLAFLSDASPVPYVINNDGTLSRMAAALLLASLVEAEQSGELPSQLVTLELGIGVGLFARFFLDAFRDFCKQHGKDYYDRLLYVAGDYSERMLRDACRQGIFRDHADHYVVRRVDALQPEEYLRHGLGVRGLGSRPLRAIFLNYVLDCLPTTILEVDGDEARQLCVRTCLSRGVNLQEHTDLTTEQLAQRARSGDQQDQADLLRVYGLFASEYSYRPVNVQEVSYGDFAAHFGRTTGRRVLHNHGAIQALERLLGLLQEDGFILVNDYGSTQVGAADEYEHQRFSDATSIGLNFPLLKAYFADGGRCRWEEPLEGGPGIHSRLLGDRLGPATVQHFHEGFAKSSYEWTNQPLWRARELSKAGRLDAAVASYQEAIARQPYNWLLMGEVAMFLAYGLRNPKAALDLTRLALDLNPTAADLWNTLGDCVFELGRLGEARRAYGRALALNSNDVRSRYGLACLEAHEKDYSAALLKIAEALAHDRMGQYRERLLQKQAEVLARLAQVHQQEYLRMTNRISTPPGTSSPWKDEPGKQFQPSAGDSDAQKRGWDS